MMVFQIVSHQPQMLTSIVRNTPYWVWSLLAALVALGSSQLFARRASPLRVCIMPVAMAAFAIYGLVTAFAHAPHGLSTAIAWLATTVSSTALAFWMHPAAPAGSRFDAPSQTFHLPGSAVPLLMILGIFLTKYIVGVELALQPSQAQDSAFVLGVASLYGAFNGIFVARLIRLWRMTRADRSPSAPAATPSPNN